MLLSTFVQKLWKKRFIKTNFVLLQDHSRITVILPEMRLLFQKYFGIVDCVCSFWGQYNLIRNCALSNNLLIFRCWGYLMKVIPKTRRVNWIWYQRFYIYPPRSCMNTWNHVRLALRKRWYQIQFTRRVFGITFMRYPQHRKINKLFDNAQLHLSTLTFVIGRLPGK
jgi:hypothetical protein